MQLSLPDAKNMEQLFSQLWYVAPFFYFIFIVALTSKYNFKGLDFIKTYFRYFFIALVVLSIIFIFLILYLSGNRSYIIYMALIIIFIIVFIKYFPKIFRSISSCLDYIVHKCKIKRKRLNKIDSSLEDTNPAPDYVLLED